jgi:hypothetical protein
MPSVTVDPSSVIRPKLSMSSSWKEADRRPNRGCGTDLSHGNPKDRQGSDEPKHADEAR